MFDTLVALLASESIEESLKQPIVDNMFGFISAKEHVHLTLKWLESSTVFRSFEDTKPIFELNKKHKYSLLKVIFKDSEIPLEKKNEMLEAVLAGDASDMAEQTRFAC